MLHSGLFYLIQYVILVYITLGVWSATAQAAAAQHQQQGEPGLATSLPIIDGWLSLKTATQISYSWKHQLSRAQDSQGVLLRANSSINSTAEVLRVPRRGTGLARLRAELNRTVEKASFAFSGTLSITNPDPIGSVVVERVELQCLWGLSIKLPCASQQQNAGKPQQLHASYAIVVHPGETAHCTVQGLSVSAEWGTNFRQSCRALATTQAGIVVQSGHFMLDFASADVTSMKGDCARLKARCGVKGSIAEKQFFKTLGAGEQLEQGLLVCANKTLDVNAVVQDVYTGQGDMPDSCSSTSELECTSDLVAVSTSSSSSSSSRSMSAHGSSLAQSAGSGSTPGRAAHLRDAVKVAIISEDCVSPPPPPSDLVQESGDVSTADDVPQPPTEALPFLQQPKVSLRIDGTYIVNNYTWLISSSVAPESLQVYANSTAAAHFSVTTLRVPTRPSLPPKYFIEGSITVENHHHKSIDVASISAVLPWGQTAMCKPDDVVLPLRLEPSAKTTCTFRLQYDLGLKPSSLRAHVNLVGNPKPLKSWPKPFKFDNADSTWSAGACARVTMDFRSDATDVSVTHAGGDAPAFDGTGTEVCDDFAKWDFTVLVTPVGKTEGVAMVVANTVVTPTSVAGGDPSSVLSRSAVTLLSAEVLPWPYTDRGPLLKASGSWRRGGEVPLVSAESGDEFLYADKNESVIIRVNI